MRSVRRMLDRLYWRMANWIVPGLVNAQRPYLSALADQLRPGIAWLDLGCGRRFVPSWLPESDRQQSQWVAQVGTAVGVDLDAASLAQNAAMPCKVLARSGQLPFADRRFDLITANMFVEHLDDPIETLKEVYRVLKPGGVFLFHTPNILNPITLMAIPLPQRLRTAAVWLLENRSEEDVFPAFYRLNRSGTIHRLANSAGLRVEQCHLIESSPETVMLGPLVILEMLLIRMTRWPALGMLRSNIVTVLRKPELALTHPTPEACGDFSQTGGTVGRAA